MAREHDFRPPERFDDYRLIRPLGQGGMGQVWLAHDTVLDRPVAVKFLSTGEPDPAARSRLLVEARAVARVRHPNVVAVHRVGEIATHPYIVVEYVPGRTLADVPLPLPPARVVEIGVGLARGLAAAHRAGVLHRDIKLGNAVLGDDGSPKLLDFGVAKLLEAKTPIPRASTPPAPERRAPMPAGAGDSTVPRAEPADAEPRDSLLGTRRERPAAAPAPSPGSAAPDPTGPTLTATGPTAEPAADATALDLSRGNTFIGTPAYMALELWDGNPATTRSDVYAFGCLLHALATGRLPIEGAGSLTDHVERLRHETIPPLDGDVDPRLAEIVARCLRREPAARFADGDELRAALEALAPTADPVALAGADLVDRLRREVAVVVLGDGAAARARLDAATRAVEAGALADGRRWRTEAVRLDPSPLEALAGALRGLEVPGAIDLVLAPEAAAAAVAKALGRERGLLLVLGDVDPLTRATAFPDAVAFARAAGALLVAGAGAVRLLAAAADRDLIRLVSLPGWSALFARARHG